MILSQSWVVWPGIILAVLSVINSFLVSSRIGRPGRENTEERADIFKDWR